MTPRADEAPPGGGRFDMDGDATRRTHLANERTMLAWWRTAFGCFAVAIGIGALLPHVTDAARWPYVLAGVGFALFGMACLLFGTIRHRDVEDAVLAGRYARPWAAVILTLTAAGAVLGVAVIALVIFGA